MPRLQGLGGHHRFKMAGYWYQQDGGRGEVCCCALRVKWFSTPRLPPVGVLWAVELGICITAMRIHVPHSPAIRFSCLSIDILQCGPKRFMAHIVKQPVTREMTPSPEKSQPLPIATISGSVTIVPTHENIFLTKLFKAIPCEDFPGMNSVSIVVTRPKMSMLPTPKKKFATIGAATLTW